MPVDEEFPLFKFKPIMDSKITVPTEHERIVSSQHIGVNEYPSPYFFHCFIHEGFCFYIGNKNRADVFPPR
jgi:hypothetical protein